MKLISSLLSAGEGLSTQKGLTALLIFLLFFIITIIPLAGFSIGKLLPHTIAVLVFISGSLFVLPRGPQRLVTLALAITAITLMWFSYFHPIPFLYSLRSILIILVMGSIASVTLAQVFREGLITWHQIRGALAGYLLIALIFAEIYRIIEMLSPRSFTLSPVLTEDPEILYAQMVYYSFRTQTTMGGDILALGAIARVFVIFQSLIGQLFPVLILGWLISQEVANRPRQIEKSQ